MDDNTIAKTLQLAIQHHQAGRLPQAELLYKQILLRQPNHPDALHLLGVIARQRGQNKRAAELIGRALAIAPNWAEAHSNLGNVLRDSGRLVEAIAAYRRAIELKPGLAESHGNLGISLHEQGRSDEAIAAYHQAIARRPDYADAHFNLGVALHSQGQLEQAEAAYRMAISLRPDLANAHYSLGLLLLSRGDFARGWAEHEWRWRCKGFPTWPRSFAQPQWDGSGLTGRIILLHDEQGFGDAIQFIRYVPLVAERGGTVIATCPPQLLRLLQTVPGVHQWLNSGNPFPQFDVHCPLMSLPLALGTSVETIARSVPYLQADADDIELWKQRMPAGNHRFRVGLAWAGSPVHKNDRNRSMPPAALGALGQFPHIQFYSLQQGDAGRQIRNSTAGFNPIDLTENLRDFADTAALIANLDLVISVDTAVAHLAGALGKPVWTMLPFTADWRWMLDRDDSPWYPTMRLFRQPKVGDWDSVVRCMADALNELQKSA